MSDFSTQSDQDLRNAIAEKLEALRVFRFGGAGSRTRNVREGRGLKKHIAQMQTELRARELAAEKKRA